MPAPRRSYVDVSFGQVHVVRIGEPAADGMPVVLLHQTPRSWDEFAEVLPLLGSSREVVAIDLPGMGGSDPHPGGSTIEHLALGVLEALDALQVGAFDLVGHHTGGVVAVEVAARAPQRVRRLVLSSTAYVDAPARARRRGRPAIDGVEVADDGSHLTELWRRRRSFYPAGRPDLLTRFVRDALRADSAEAGHLAVGAYEMELRLPFVAAETLVVGHAEDPHAFPDFERMTAELRSILGDGRVRTATIDDGMVPLELTATEFARIVADFLEVGTRLPLSGWSS